MVCVLNEYVQESLWAAFNTLLQLAGLNFVKGHIAAQF